MYDLGRNGVVRAVPDGIQTVTGVKCCPTPQAAEIITKYAIMNNLTDGRVIYPDESLKSVLNGRSVPLNQLMGVLSHSLPPDMEFYTNHFITAPEEHLSQSEQVREEALCALSVPLAGYFKTLFTRRGNALLTILFDILKFAKIDESKSPALVDLTPLIDKLPYAKDVFRVAKGPVTFAEAHDMVALHLGRGRKEHPLIPPPRWGPDLPYPLNMYGAPTFTSGQYLLAAAHYVEVAGLPCRMENGKKFVKADSALARFYHVSQGTEIRLLHSAALVNVSVLHGRESKKRSKAKHIQGATKKGDAVLDAIQKQVKQKKSKASSDD